MKPSRTENKGYVHAAVGRLHTGYYKNIFEEAAALMESVGDERFQIRFHSGVDFSKVLRGFNREEEAKDENKEETKKMTKTKCT